MKLSPTTKVAVPANIAATPRKSEFGPMGRSFKGSWPLWLPAAARRLDHPAIRLKVKAEPNTDLCTYEKSCEASFSLLQKFMAVEFDPATREAVLRERGLDMARAEEIFRAGHLTVQDSRRDYGEIRNITIGFLAARMVDMVWTPRGRSTRIISLRKANEREQALYAPRFG